MKIKGLSYLGNKAQEAKLNGSYIYKGWNSLDIYNETSDIRNIFYGNYNSGLMKYKQNKLNSNIAVIYLNYSTSTYYLAVFNSKLKKISEVNLNINNSNDNICCLDFVDDLIFITLGNSTYSSTYVSSMYEFKDNTLIKKFDTGKLFQGSTSSSLNNLAQYCVITEDKKYLIASNYYSIAGYAELFRINEDSLTYISNITHYGEIDKTKYINGKNYLFFNVSLSQTTNSSYYSRICYIDNDTETITSVLKLNFSYPIKINLSDDFGFLSVSYKTSSNSSSAYLVLYKLDENCNIITNLTPISNNSYGSYVKTIFFKYKNIDYCLYYYSAYLFGIVKYENGFLTNISTIYFTSSIQNIINTEGDYLVFVFNYRYVFYKKEDLINNKIQAYLTLSTNSSQYLKSIFNSSMFFAYSYNSFSNFYCYYL